MTVVLQPSSDVLDLLSVLEDSDDEHSKRYHLGAVAVYRGAPVLAMLYGLPDGFSI